MQDRMLQFKFLSGDKIGAKFFLNSNRYLLGNTLNCDIFSDDNENDSHELEIFINDNLEVFISAIKGVFYVNGIELKGKHKLLAKEIVSFSLCSFMYAKSKEDFNLINLNEVFLKKEQNIKLQNEDNFSKKADTKDHIESFHLDKKRILFLSLGIFILSFLLISLLFGAILFKDKDTLDVDIENLEQYIKQNENYKDIFVTKSDNDIYFNGFIDSNKHLKEFILNMPKLSHSSIIKIKTKEDYINSIVKSFALRDLFFHVNYDKDLDKYIAYGYVKDKNVEANAYLEVKKDLNIDNLIFKSTYKDKLLDIVNSLNDKYNLNLKFNYLKGKVLYKDELNFDNLDKFTAFKEEVSKEVQAPVIFEFDKDLLNSSIDYYKDEIKEVVSENNYFDILGFNAKDITGVTLEPLRFLSLKDGSRLFEGSLLESGYIIKTISINNIVLYKGNNKVVYELK